MYGNISYFFHSNIMNVHSHYRTKNRFVSLLAKLATFGIQMDDKMADIIGFRPLSGIMITQYTSYLVHTLGKWTFRNGTTLGHDGLIPALRWPEVAEMFVFQLLLSL